MALHNYDDRFERKDIAYSILTIFLLVFVLWVTYSTLFEQFRSIPRQQSLSEWCTEQGGYYAYQGLFGADCKFPPK